jgi:hypothetical protein
MSTLVRMNHFVHLAENHFFVELIFFNKFKKPKGNLLHNSHKRPKKINGRIGNASDKLLSEKSEVLKCSANIKHVFT